MPLASLLQALATLMLINASITMANTSAFDHLNVHEAIQGTKYPPTKENKFYDVSENMEHTISISDANQKWKLKLLQRDKISLETYSNYHHRFNRRIQRERKRVSGIMRHLSGEKYEVTDFGSDIVSGMEQGSGEYFARLGVGSPPRDQYMVIDSGSDIIWVQCQPCSQCYSQSDPVFDPATSASFSGVPCGSSVCDRLDSAVYYYWFPLCAGKCHEGRCRYEVQYGDGSYTKGTLALETLTFDGTQVHDVAIGCGHKNRGMFIGAAGLLGLGGGPMSFVGQLGGPTSGVFGYCLVSRRTELTGSLEFGRQTLPEGAMWVPLLHNPRAPSFYYVGLAGLGVGGVRVAIPENLFMFSEFGDGGVVMDTGTAVTRLPLSAYVAFKDTFVEQTASLPRAQRVSIFDTCYDLNGFVSVRVLTISFYFSGGPILTLPAQNFLIPVNEMGTFCFAFAPSSSGLSIIGNIQQEGIQISIDGANGFLGFGPNVC